MEAPAINAHMHAASRRMSGVLHSYAEICGALTIAIGLTTLVGWLAGIPVLTELIPGAASMKPNTAASLMLLGIALILVTHADRAAQAPSVGFGPTALAQGATSLVAIVATLTLLQYMFHINLGVDTLLIDVHGASPYPARMAPISAVALLLLSASLLTHRFSNARRICIAEIFALLAGSCALVAILGYGYGVNSMYAVQMYTSIAIHTAIALLLLATGVLGSTHRFAIFRGLSQNHARGMLLRRLVPAAIVVPPLLGWVRLRGQQAGWYSTEFGLAMLVCAHICIFSILIWMTALKIETADRQRLEAQRRLHAQVRRLNLLRNISGAITYRQTLNSIYDVTVERVRTDLPVHLCAVCEVLHTDNALRVIAISAEDAMTLVGGQRVPGAVTLLADLDQTDAIYISDTASVTNELGRQLASASFGSMVMAPLRIERRVQGVLIAARRDKNGFEPEDIEFIHQLGYHMSVALEQSTLHTSLQAAYDELKLAQSALMQEERLRALSEMSSGVAHDINNAISPITLYTQLLIEREPGLSPTARQTLCTIQGCIKNVGDTVTRMREFSRPPPENVEWTALDLNTLVHEVLELTRPAWKDQALSRGAQISIQLELSSAPTLVRCAGRELHDAVTNLVLNAIDAMPGGGSLTFRTSNQRGLVSLQVTDSGTGMSEDVARHCFEPFFTTKGARGTGLGLAMVYGTVQRHDGSIRVQSAPGAGTSFVLQFAATAPTTSKKTPLSRESIEPRRFLVIEDDPMLRSTLTEVLSVDGHCIATAEDGIEGVATFVEAMQHLEPFDVVLTDYGMPRMDGRAVATAIKQASPTTPVILLTGWARRMIDDCDIPSDVDQVLAKPPTLPELRAVIADVLAHRPRPLPKPASTTGSFARVL